MRTIPVDLTKTGGRLLDPGVQQLRPDELRRALETAPVSAPAPSSLPATPMTPPAAPPETPAAPAFCRHCGADPQSEPEKPTSEDYFEFAKSVWRGETFVKSYTFFGGALRVDFRAMSSDELDMTQRAVMVDAATDEAMVGPAGALAMMDRGEDYQMTTSIARLVVGDKRYDGPARVDDVRATRAAVRACLAHQIAYQTVRTAYRKFYSLTKAMIDRGHDPSFWPATPHSGFSPDSPPPATSR